MIELERDGFTAIRKPTDCSHPLVGIYVRVPLNACMAGCRNCGLLIDFDDKLRTRLIRDEPNLSAARELQTLMRKWSAKARQS